MTNYKKILTSSEEHIKKYYYHYLLINNFCLLKNFSSFQHSLFDKSILDEEEQKQFVFVLTYLLETDHPLFQVTPVYLERLKKYFFVLLNNKEYRRYRKVLFDNLRRIDENRYFYKKCPCVIPSIWKSYIETYGLKVDNPSTSLISKFVSSDLLMYDYLFIHHLDKIIEESFSKEKVFYAASLSHILYTLPLDLESLLPSIEKRMNQFLDAYLNDEKNEPIILFGNKLNILWERYLQIYKKNKISFLPERGKLVYQSEPLNGKILKFQKEDF